MRLLMAILLVALVMSALGCAQEDPGSSLEADYNIAAAAEDFDEVVTDDIDEVAAAALETFGMLVTEQNCEGLGFSSPDEVQVATLGEPVRVFRIRLDDLQECEERTSFLYEELATETFLDELLSGGDQYIYPVMVEGEVRSSLVVEWVNEKWEATQFGGSNLVRVLDGVRQESSEYTGLPASAYYLVRVPALNLYFLTNQADEVLFFTPLFDDPDLKFEAGVAMTAVEVLAIIVPLAQEHEDLPS